jgi:hypothetical protein
MGPMGSHDEKFHDRASFPMEIAFFPMGNEFFPWGEPRYHGSMSFLPWKEDFPMGRLCSSMGRLCFSMGQLGFPWEAHEADP